MPREWPMSTFIELGALPGAVPCARLHARQVLWEWRLEEFTNATELVVSELVTNAVQVSQALTGSRYDGRWMPGVPPVRLWLVSDGERIVIHVWDASHLMPEAQDAGLDAETGRGLLLISSMCTGWGTYTPEGATGKIVWAEVGVTCQAEGALQVAVCCKDASI